MPDLINNAVGGQSEGIYAVTVGRSTTAGLNRPPIAVDDILVVTQDIPKTFTVLTNDSDPDGDPIDVFRTTQPSHGTVVHNGNKTLTYTPDPGYAGPDSFTYSINDGRGGTAVATVTITVEPLPVTPFVFTIETAVPDEVFTFPAYGVGDVNAVIDWGDGTETIATSLAAPELSHTFAVAGEQIISVTGILPGVRFQGTPAATKLRTVQSLGHLEWKELTFAFEGCTGLTSFTAGTGVNTSGVEFFNRMFRGCSALVSVDLTGVTANAATNMSQMFHSCTNLVAVDLSVITDTQLVTNLSGLFYGCTNLASANVAFPDGTPALTTLQEFARSCPALHAPVGLNGFNVDKVTNLQSFFLGGYMDTPTYDALLISWAAQTVKTGIITNMGTSKYTAGGAAEAAKLALVNTYTWTIADGGAAS